MQTGKVANHPFVIVQLPIKRRAPLFAIDCFPAFGKPPVKVLIATVVDEFEKVAVADGSFVDQEVLDEDLVLRFLVVERKWSRARSVSAVVAEPDQSTFDL